jgi:hypothetical protein
MGNHFRCSLKGGQTTLLAELKGASNAMRILKFAATIAAGVVALGVAAYAYFLYSPDPTPPHLSGRVQTATIQVGSRLRSYVE